MYRYVSVIYHRENNVPTSAHCLSFNLGRFVTIMSNYRRTKAGDNGKIFLDWWCADIVCCAHLRINVQVLFLAVFSLKTAVIRGYFCSL